MNVILCAIAYKIILCAVVHFHFSGCTNSQGAIRYQLGWLFSRRYQLGWQFQRRRGFNSSLQFKDFLALAVKKKNDDD